MSNDKLTGRELDCELAIECFNADVVYLGDGNYVIESRIHHHSEHPDIWDLPHFHKDMGDAWQIAEWIKERTETFSLTFDSDLCHWECIYGVNEFNEDAFEIADTPTEAICYAALELARQLKGAGNE